MALYFYNQKNKFQILSSERGYLVSTGIKTGTRYSDRGPAMQPRPQVEVPSPGVLSLLWSPPLQGLNLATETPGDPVWGWLP